ncbi:MAG: YbaB/EbfC family nucleoid-associated protein [Anaerolineales bacterium]
MSKRSFGGFSGGGQGMMQQLQQLQEQMKKAQEELAAAEVTGSAGGGAVKVVFSGDQKCKAVEIDPDLLEGVDQEMLQDLILAAIKNGLEKANDLAAEKLGPLAGGGLPF